MTRLIQCNNADCAQTLSEDARHIALKVEGMPDMPVIEVDGMEVHQLLELSAPGFLADTHFCSMVCLCSWAMAQHLDEQAHWRDGTE